MRPKSKHKINLFHIPYTLCGNFIQYFKYKTKLYGMEFSTCGIMLMYKKYQDFEAEFQFSDPQLITYVRFFFFFESQKWDRIKMFINVLCPCFTE